MIEDNSTGGGFKEIYSNHFTLYTKEETEDSKEHSGEKKQAD